MFAITGRQAPYAIGLLPLKSPRDTGADQPAEYQAAVELLLKVLRESEKPVTILTAGSVRDVTAACNREPQLLRQKVLAVYINIGNSDVGGREYNVDLDIHAFRGLLTSGLNIYWFPCFPQNGKATAYWKMPSMAQALGASPAPLQDYFAFAIRKSDPAKEDPMAALRARPAPAEQVFKGGKDMWCTASILAAAGYKVYRVEGRFAAGLDVPAGAGGETLRFRLRAVEVGEDGKTTKVQYGAPDANVRVIQVPDLKLYGQAMDDCLRQLLSQFPTRF